MLLDIPVLYVIFIIEKPAFSIRFGVLSVLPSLINKQCFLYLFKLQRTFPILLDTLYAGLIINVFSMFNICELPEKLTLDGFLK